MYSSMRRYVKSNMQLTFVAVYTLLFGYLPTDSKENEANYCFTLNNEIECESLSNIRLTRLEAHESGYVENIKTEDGREIHMKTLAVKPLILEIPEFLTKEECRHLIDLAVAEGLQSSETLNWSDKNRFLLQDTDNDKRLNLDEMKVTLMGGFDVHFDKEDILQMYKEMNIDKDNDEYITQKEMESFSPRHFEVYIKKFVKSHPEKHSRYSRQVWLWPDTSEDEVFNRIINRASTIVDLPVELLKLSDFQVVNYNIKGHYHAHWDSAGLDVQVPCCDQVKKRDCRICRYMTILFYLNDVEDGGDTAFPVANNETVNIQDITKEELFNLNQKCGTPGISVKAETGKAIIWYNHFVDPESGWLGEQDVHTYHGGCPVRKGEKWVANFWIKITDDKKTDLSKMYKYHKDNLKKLKKQGKDEL